MLLKKCFARTFCYPFSPAKSKFKQALITKKGYGKDGRIFIHGGLLGITQILGFDANYNKLASALHQAKLYLLPSFV
jgi:hypothetical protein